VLIGKDRIVGRQKVVRDLKRGLIPGAAGKVFEMEGLDGASLRSIAGASGYTPAALYFHFESKEAIYRMSVDRFNVILCETIPLANHLGIRAEHIGVREASARIVFTETALDQAEPTMVRH
jgi:AcrR family transcriptional regulator